MKFFNFSFLVCFLLFSFSYAIDIKLNEPMQTKKYTKGENKIKKLSYSQSIGKNIYDANCKKCHGEYGKKRTSSKSRKLAEMTSEEIYYAFKGYLINDSFGGSSRLTMQAVSNKITLEQLEKIISYIKNEDDFLKRNYKLKNTEISKKPTSKGVYIK